MKGILFAGDSFTWGEGLHLYSGLPNTNYDEHGYNNGLSLSPAHIKFIESHRFARKVANHFDTFELCRHGNGGNNVEIFDFIDSIENTTSSLQFEQLPFLSDGPAGNNHTKYRFILQDFDYIIIQLTDMFRNEVKFNYKDISGYCNIKSMESIKNSGFDKYLKDEFDNDINLFIQYYLKTTMDNIEEKIKKYESKGIKRCFIHTWQNEPIPFIQNNPFLNERWITYIDNVGTKFNSIWDLQSRNERQSGMSISDDPYFQSIGKKVVNGHTSLTAHNIQARAIIKKIEEYEQSTIHSV